MNQEMRFWLVFVRDHRVLTFASGRLLRTLHTIGNMTQYLVLLQTMTFVGSCC